MLELDDVLDREADAAIVLGLEPRRRRVARSRPAITTTLARQRILERPGVRRATRELPDHRHPVPPPGSPLVVVAACVAAVALVVSPFVWRPGGCAAGLVLA